MNKLLQKLADQCRTEYHDGHSGFTEQFDEEKFAELIVAECVSSIKAKAAEVPVFDEADRSWKMGTEFAVHIILEHFGVEE